MKSKLVQLVKPKKGKIDNKYGFYSFIRPLLYVYRYLGILPISGLRHTTSNLTRGTLKAWYSTIYFIVILLQTLRFMFITYEIFQMKNRFASIEKFANILISVSNYLELLYLTRLSLKWEPLITQIESMEKLVPSRNDQRILKLIRYLIAAMCIIATVDFCLFTISSWQLVKNCYSDEKDMGPEQFYNHVFSWMAGFLPFHLASLAFLLFLRLQMHLIWSCIDTFIMVVSIYLWCKFHYFNEIIAQKQQSDQSRGVASWCSLQVHYTNISRIVTVVNESISPMILLSYFCNLLYIFKQIFHIIKSFQVPESLKTVHCALLSLSFCIFGYRSGTIVFFTFSCFFVILRTALVSHFASKLNIASREPLNALHTFPSSAFNIDMQRLMTQVYFSNISLTGYNFFSVTRNLTLAMVGTLITYELVLFQL